MRVLVVEDEARLCESLKEGLGRGGLWVEACGSGEEALRLALSNTYGAIVLDLTLPDRDGLEILAELRRSGCTVPVLILTARGGIGDRVRGLNAGADDYLPKPFAFAELLARLLALARRGVAQSSYIEIADLRIDLIVRKAHRSGRTIDLTAKEFALLECLALNAGKAVTRTTIAERVWGIHFDSFTNVIDVYIRYLRRKIDDPFPEKLIHTHRGVGYSLGSAE
jgi:two-component system, OmpR family, copper resistance phosphate regulon response regulator CusR